MNQRGTSHGSMKDLQWLQNPRDVSGENLKNVRREARRNFRNKKRKYLEHKKNNLATNSKNNNTRDLYIGIHKFMRGYQPRSNLLNDENGDLLADSPTF
jgi:hypothetical protein